MIYGLRHAIDQFAHGFHMLPTSLSPSSGLGGAHDGKAISYGSSDRQCRWCPERCRHWYPPHSITSSSRHACTEQARDIASTSAMATPIACKTLNPYLFNALLCSIILGLRSNVMLKLMLTATSEPALLQISHSIRQADRRTATTSSSGGGTSDTVRAWWEACGEMGARSWGRRASARGE